MFLVLGGFLVYNLNIEDEIRESIVAKAKEVEEAIEKQLWKAADKLRKNIDAAEYKHVVLGLIFIKYISDAFEDLRAREQPNDMAIG